MPYKVIRVLLLFIFFAQTTFVGNSDISGDFKTGCEVFLENPGEIYGKPVAVVTNQTGIARDGKHIVDIMHKAGFNVLKIFSPEHGIRGDENYLTTDPVTGITVISLYGEKKKPTAADLADIDVLIYDIQDVGARFYTYTSTLKYILEAAYENRKKVIVLDRPMVINPNYTDGFMLDPEFYSFVGSVPVPICYGMTPGELASYLNYKLFNDKVRLEVIEMNGYRRSSDFTSLNIQWIKPSPSILYPSSAVCYPATCLLEGTNVSEGRGTDKPFEYAGAPWINEKELSDELNSYGLNGVEFIPVRFTPSRVISNYPPKYLNQECGGVFIKVNDKNLFEPVKCGIAMLYALNKLYKSFRFTGNNFIDKLAGTDRLRKSIINGTYFRDIILMWDNELEEFKKEREKFLIYR